MGFRNLVFAFDHFSCPSSIPTPPLQPQPWEDNRATVLAKLILHPSLPATPTYRQENYKYTPKWLMRVHLATRVIRAAAATTHSCVRPSHLRVGEGPGTLSPGSCP